MKYFGIFGFADDLKHLSPSLLGLQRMLNICKAFSTSTGLTFNARKTLCIKFHYGHHVNEITQYTIFLGNDKLKWYSQVEHLGHTFNWGVNFSADVIYIKGQFIGCVNSIITQFGFVHHVCKLKLLVTHGYSFYGSSLWHLCDNDSKKLYISWNIAVCRLYDFPRTAHTRFLAHIAGVPHLNLNLKCRFAKYLYIAINSHNERIAFLTKLCMYNTMSITGSNVCNMLCEFNINMSDIINGSASNLMKTAYTGFNAVPGEQWKCDMILELTDCIYGFS